MSSLFLCVLFELLVLVGLLDYLYKLPVFAFVLEHGQLGGPKFWLVNSYFVFLHVAIDLILVADHAGIA